MKLYVAGKWAHRDKLLIMANNLESLGHTITHKWMEVENHLDTMDLRKTADRGQLALADTKAVEAADVMVVIIDDADYAYRGTFCEVGVAIGTGTPIVLLEDIDIPIGSKVDTNIFFRHPAIEHVKSWDDVIAFLIKTRNNC